MNEHANFIKQAFARMNLEQLRALILSGTEDLIPQCESYAVRLTNASDPIYARINSLYTKHELTDATNEISKAVNTFQEVYFEIGMKAGARLVHQLLLTDDGGISRRGGTE